MKKIKILTVILHSLILIGIGHGGIFLLLFELGSIPALFNGKIEFDFNADYEDKLMLSGLISLIGKVFLIFSFFVKTNFNKTLTELIGLVFLWLSVYSMTSGKWDYNSLAEFSFWSSVPFLISSLILTGYIIERIKKK